MSDEPKDYDPVSKGIPQSPTASVGLNWLSLLLLAAGGIWGVAAVAGETDNRVKPCPGTGTFGAGCVIAAAILISRKPN